MSPLNITRSLAPAATWGSTPPALHRRLGCMPICMPCGLEPCLLILPFPPFQPPTHPTHHLPTNTHYTHVYVCHAFGRPLLKLSPPPLPPVSCPTYHLPPTPPMHAPHNISPVETTTSSEGACRHAAMGTLDASSHAACCCVCLPPPIPPPPLPPSPSHSLPYLRPPPSLHRPPTSLLLSRL